MIIDQHAVHSKRKQTDKPHHHREYFAFKQAKNEKLISHEKDS